MNRLMSERRLHSEARSQALTKYDIALFIEENGKTRWSNLLKEFVENQSERHMSRQKLSLCLKELVDEGLVQKTIDKKALALRMLWRVYPIYVVPESRLKRIEEIRNKKEIYDFIDSASPEKIKKLHEEIGHLRETEEEGQ
jgi:DNA-binding HxlR family transcriptional regulator